MTGVTLTVTVSVAAGRADAVVVAMALVTAVVVEVVSTAEGDVPKVATNALGLWQPAGTSPQVMVSGPLGMSVTQPVQRSAV